MGYKIIQGEDLILDLLVLDANNNPVDLTLADKIRAYFTVKGYTAYKYQDITLETAISGYGVCEIDIAVSNLLKFNVLRNQSQTFPIGNLVINVLVEEPDVDLTIKRTEYSFAVGEVLKGVLKDENLT